ncbi:MAG TPA: tetratricopeptide repeat protein [Candidatus Saccharimonadales bacterium]|nr:tetratricopeptide repeat protein [Candidatus Saccharimonadales bacterium]
MQSYTRRQLKEDKFAESAKGAMQWASGHQQGTLWAVLIAVAVAALGAGLYFWHERQSEQANLALTKAIRTFEARLRPAGTPAGDDLSFNSIAERAKQAEKELQAVADSYSMTKAGRIARFMAAAAAAQGGDNASAEKQLKSLADSNNDVAGLAKMALATLYHSAGRDSDAAKTYKELIDHPTGTVGKAQAQFALAEMYESTDPKQSEVIYKQIQDENKDTAFAQLAASKVAGAKGKQ